MVRGPVFPEEEVSRGMENKADSTSLPRSQSKNLGRDAGRQSMLVHGSDNALIAAYRRIERVRRARPAAPRRAARKFTLSVPAFTLLRITRVSRTREDRRYVD